MLQKQTSNSRMGHPPYPNKQTNKPTFPTGGRTRLLQTETPLDWGPILDLFKPNPEPNSHTRITEPMSSLIRQRVLTSITFTLTSITFS